MNVSDGSLFLNSPTELTTSATDAVLAIECVAVGLFVCRAPSADRWRAALWASVFGLVAFSSVLGAVVHGFDLSNTVRSALWKPLYLSLGVLVALFVVGALYDWRGRGVAVRFLPWSIGVGVAFFGWTQSFSDSFVVFVGYEALAMLSALAIYLRLAATRQLPGAGIVATAILVNLLAAGVQASSLSIRIGFPFDHNGVFHLIQMIGIALLGLGLSRASSSATGPTQGVET